MLIIFCTLYIESEQVWSSNKDYDAITCNWSDVVFYDAISDFHFGISPCYDIESEHVWTCLVG